MPTVDFIPFANDPSAANVLSQADYLAAASGSGYVQDGFPSGRADSNKANKIWRQTSVMTAALANFISAKLGGADVLDSGGAASVTALQAQIKAAIEASPAFTGTPTAPTATAGTNSTQLATCAFVAQHDANVAITGGTISGITDLTVADGGTGASTASGARTNLGLGSMATQAASAVAITGGTISGITDLTVADGGTGASDAATARTNLGTVAATDFGASLGTNGYQRLPSGLLMQWGKVSFTGSGAEGILGPYSFPISFPNACLNISVTTITPESPGFPAAGDNIVMMSWAYPPSTTQFYVWSNLTTGTNASDGFFWQAIGH